MDNIFDRGKDLLDKAHERVASTATQAAWIANQSLVIRHLEGQVTALQSEIDRATLEVGEYTYQAWKAGAADPRVPALCGHVDGLAGKIEGVKADLAAARSATYSPATAGMWSGSPAVAALPMPTVTQVVPPPAPQPAPAPPPVTQPGRATTAPAPPLPQPPVDPRKWDVAPSRSAMPVSGPDMPPRPADRPTPGPRPAARECVNCGHFIHAGDDYCPSCGFKSA